ncbi:MAG: hypothetical protein HYT16_02510 [DPANN group archaeon]|nr:hypothetical protein [DPANN group archaeon]
MAAWLSEKSVTVLAVLVALVAVGAPLLTGNTGRLAIATGTSSLPFDFSVTNVNVPEPQYSYYPVRGITATFRNTGPISFGFVNYKMEISSSKGHYYRDGVGTVTLPARGSASAEMPAVHDLPAGEYNVKVTIDYLGEHSETDESNNAFTTKLVIKG